jgi:hypothetical protein
MPSDAYFASVPPIPSDSSSGCASTAINLGVRIISVFSLCELTAASIRGGVWNKPYLLIRHRSCEITEPKFFGYAPSGANYAVVHGPQ